jgi:hypothetical protein
MNTLLLLIIIVAFIFIVTYDPKKGKPLPEFYQPEPVPELPHTCDESRFLELQGLKSTCVGHTREIAGAVV